MPTPLASLFSTIDSIKRILADRASDPAEDLKRTLGRAAEDAAAFRATQKAGLPEATEAMLNTVLNFSPVGMIVPAERVLGFQAFNKANKELKMGADPEATYKATGAYKMPQDDVLRAVISDLGAKLKTADLTGKNAPKAVGELLDHPELFAKMPELADIKIKPDIGYKSAAYGTGNAAAGDPSYIRLGSFTDPKELISAVLHEIQHGVQHIGNMAGGGNPAQFISDIARVELAKGAADAVYREKSKALTKALEVAGIDRYSKAAKSITAYGPMSAARKESIALDKITASALDKYLALPGETEARLVEEMFKAGKGAATFPPKFQATVEDLNREDLIPTHYVDLQDHIQSLLDKFAPRK